MSENENSFDLDEFLVLWTLEYGVRKTTYVEVKQKMYPEAMNSLIQSLLEKGYDEEKIKQASLLRKLQDILVPEKTLKKVNISNWKKQVAHDWKIELAEAFGKSNDIKPAKPRKQRVAPKPKDLGVDIDISRPTLEDKDYLGLPDPADELSDEEALRRMRESE